jgi:hypothetical protein
VKKLAVRVVAGLVVRYTITAKDPQGRTGEFKPFEVQASQITIVE